MRVRKSVLIPLLFLIMLSAAIVAGVAGERLGLIQEDQAIGGGWRETSPIRVIITSTCDWGRILFDDFNGTNSNGLRIRSVADVGWITGRDDDDHLYAGRKLSWPDTEYDRVIVREGDMAAFFKGLGDFDYVEAYADLVLEVNLDMQRVYVWLMTGGNGTTTFELVSRETGGTIWRDVIVGAGETQQVRRVMSPQPLLRTGRAETTVLVAWLTIAILAMIVLNFPSLELIGRLLRRKSKPASQAREKPRHDGGR
jgi:hypothetical protein